MVSEAVKDNFFQVMADVPLMPNIHIMKDMFKFDDYVR